MRKTSCPSGWLNQIKGWAVEVGCTWFAFALEVGKRAEHLHVQGCFECRGTASPSFITLLRTHIQEYIPTPRGTGGFVNVQAFRGTQTKQYMLGYVQKDIGKGHFQVRPCLQMGCVLFASLVRRCHLTCRVPCRSSTLV